MKTSIVTDLSSLAAAFTEWDRRFREEPERFESEAVRLLKSDPKTYGEACAPYLVKILAETITGRSGLSAASPRRRESTNRRAASPAPKRRIA